MDLPNTNITPTTNSDPNNSTDPSSRPETSNPFSDPAPPLPALLAVSSHGSNLVTHITKYLSTLPHPIEVIEELVAVIAVTCSLLNALHNTISRFPDLRLSPTHSFLAPLCADLLFAFGQFSERVQEARRLRVFEPNDVGLVRLPRAAWILVCGTEAKVNALRSRLYVEKYRVRVLIEAVAWEGLGRMRECGCGGSVWARKQEEEWKALKKMLPLIAERMVGVQRDYMPRLLKINGLVPDPEAKFVKEKEGLGRAAVVRNVVVQNAFPRPMPMPAAVPIAQPRMDGCQQVFDEKAAVRSSAVARPLSTSTQIASFRHETWLLRHNRPSKTLSSRTSLLGLPILSTHTYSPSTYYVKPMLSSASETSALLQQIQGSNSELEHEQHVKNLILSLDDAAQHEIQRLCEARENASSGQNVKRTWRVVGLLERPARQISPSLKSRNGRPFWKRSSKPAVEWVVILKGETVDHEQRDLPLKHVDPWKPKPVVNPPPASAPQAVGQIAMQQQQRQQAQLQHGTVLRHVENRQVLSLEEAEARMREMSRDLFVCEPESEDEESSADEESESESESDEGFDAYADEDSEREEGEDEPETQNENENEDEQIADCKEKAQTERRSSAYVDERARP